MLSHRQRRISSRFFGNLAEIVAVHIFFIGFFAGKFLFKKVPNRFNSNGRGPCFSMHYIKIVYMK